LICQAVHCYAIFVIFLFLGFPFNCLCDTEKIQPSLLHCYGYGILPQLV